MSKREGGIEGRVAAILNARELVINKGVAHGVKLGMKFAVLAETPLIVKDPITGIELDEIDREKVRVETTEVRPSISICRTYRVKRTKAGPFAATAMPDFLGLTAPSKTIPESFRIADSSSPPPLPEEESYVKVKDRVVEVSDD